MTRSTVALLHYTAPPVIGGVEAVIESQARLFLWAGFQVAILAGRGAASALPADVEFNLIPEIDSLHPQAVSIGAALAHGHVPAEFESVAQHLAEQLSPILSRFDHVIVHNVLTKHFNLPLTAALHDMVEAHVIRHCIAWCHDLSWTSPHSRAQVHAGYPWDLLRTMWRDVTYVTVSHARQRDLAQLFNCAPDMIHVVFNGVDPDVLLDLSTEGRSLIDRLDILDSDLVLLMPVRVTPAKNIELALHVVAAMKARGCRIRLIVTGPPDPHDADRMAYFRSLRRLRAQLKIEQDARFVFESGPSAAQAYLIDEQRVAELYRVSDVLFMPSHHEGFGMPVLEAGLVGMPVACTEVPAAKEIGGENVLLFRPDASPESVADLILTWAEHSPVHRLRRRIRQNFTWPAIFRSDIVPLLMSERQTA